MEKTPTNTVLTKEEIETLTSLQKQQNDLIFNLGQIEYQLTFLNKQKTQTKQNFETLESKQTEVGKEIEKKYGQGSVNLETGEFIKP